MGQSTEEIEAKLAAYVDGSLDDAGRAEIEKHLASHPQHRTLLADLSQHRDLLRSLPGEKAPPEILEAIQFHLERRLLLEEGAHVAGRIGPGTWSRVMSIAAVLLLAATLGLVIYSVVPSSRTGSDEFAVVERAEAPTDASTAAAPKPADASVSPGVAAPGGVGGGEGSVIGGSTTPLADRVATAAVDALQPREIPAITGGRITDFDPVAVAARTDPSSPGGLSSPTDPTSSGITAAPPLSLDREAVASAGAASVLLLVADDPVATERDLSRVFNDNAVSFEQVASAAPLGSIAPRGAEESAFRAGAAPTTGPAESNERLASRELRGRDLADEDSRMVANSALANAGPRSQDAQNDSVFYARKLSRAQYQAINDALSRMPRAKQQVMPPELQQQQQMVAQIQSNVLKEAGAAQDKLAYDEKKAELGKSKSDAEVLGKELELGEKNLPQTGGAFAARQPAEVPQQQEPLTDVVIVVRGAASESERGNLANETAQPLGAPPATAPAEPGVVPAPGVAPTTAPSTMPNS